MPLFSRLLLRFRRHYHVALRRLITGVIFHYAFSDRLLPCISVAYLLIFLIGFAYG